MTTELTDGQQTRMAVAVLVSSLVRAMSKDDAAITSEFLTHLGDSYYFLRDRNSDSIGVIESINWTRDLINAARA